MIITKTTDSSLFRKSVFCSKIFYFCSVFFIFLSFLKLNFNFELNINDYFYNLNFINFFLIKGLEYNTLIIKIPILLRVLNILLIPSFLLSTFFLFNKNKLIYISILFNIILIFTIGLFFTIFIKANIEELNLTVKLFNFYKNFLNSILCLSISLSLISFINNLQKFGEIIFKILAFFSVFCVFLITVYIFYMGMPAILKIGLKDFIFNLVWKPSENKFGILTFIISSLASAFGSMILGAPLGVLTAVFIIFYCPNFLKNKFRMLTRVLSGVPSVIFGFFGIIVIVPYIRKLFYGYSSGDSLLAAIIILTIMILPTIINITEDALKAVPYSFFEGALALGETKIRIIFKIIIPSAMKGILTGILLGISRAIGETAAVIMVSGNSVNFPNLLRTSRFLTTGISLEMAYSSGIHRKALFSIGLVLFIFIFIVNLIFIFVSNKMKK